MAQPAALASDFSETLAKAAEEGGEAVLQLLARLLGRLGEIPGAWIRTERGAHHRATGATHVGVRLVLPSFAWQMRCCCTMRTRVGWSS